MRVLMIGWEFPPHISGGLGTACKGILQGLVHKGVDVTFVVPRIFGDEDAAGARLVSAEDVERGSVPPPDALPAGSKAAPSRAAVPGMAPAGPRPSSFSSPGHIEVLGVDSPLTPYLDEAAYRGVRRRIAEAVRGLAAAPATAPVAASPPPAPDAPPPPPAPVDLGLSEPAPSPRYGRDLLGEVSRYAAAVEHLAREVGFDVVHAHDWMTFPAGILAARAAGKPLIVHVHSCEYDRAGEGADPRIVAVEQAGLDAAARVICVSHYTEGVLAARYRLDPSRVRVLHNAVTHEEQRRDWHQEKTIPEPVVLFLGRVTFQKGPDYFLEAARLVVKEEPGVRFVLGGRGDMLPRMIEQAARLGLARHVHFTGFLSGADVERMYAMADIYVMPSVSEPFGIAPLEAMALDVPVIVSRQSGVAEVLRSALKVDFWDVRDMANKILALLRYPVLRRHLVEDGRAEVAAMRWEVRGRILRGIYREVAP